MNTFITPQLLETIRGGYKDVLSEFDPESYTKEEIIAVLYVTEVLKYKTD